MLYKIFLFILLAYCQHCSYCKPSHASATADRDEDKITIQGAYHEQESSRNSNPDPVDSTNSVAADSNEVDALLHQVQHNLLSEVLQKIKEKPTLMQCTDQGNNLLTSIIKQAPTESPELEAIVDHIMLKYPLYALDPVDKVDKKCALQYAIEKGWIVCTRHILQADVRIYRGKNNTLLCTSKLLHASINNRPYHVVKLCVDALAADTKLQSMQSTYVVGKGCIKKGTPYQVLKARIQGLKQKKDPQTARLTQLKRALKKKRKQ